MSPTIQNAAAAAARQAPEPLSLTAERSVGYHERHELVHVLPAIGVPALAVDKPDAIGVTVDPDRPRLAPSARPCQGRQMTDIEELLPAQPSQVD